MSQQCPISFQKVDANLYRFTAIQIVMLMVLWFSTGSFFVAFILFLDFLVRFLGLKHYSLTYLVAHYITKKLELTPRMSDYAPKKFALHLGLIISSLIVVSLMFGLNQFASVIGVILLFCALLEALFEYCVGCKLYYVLGWLQQKVMR
jgi:hypothetical protein